MLDAELGRFKAHLDELRRPVVDWLSPGVGVDHVSSVLDDIVPASVVQWFGWCNGVVGYSDQLPDDVNVIPGYNPLSIDEAVRLKPDYADDPVLGKHWVPLLGNLSGDLYAAVWVPGTEAKVVGVLIGEPTEVEFSSIEQMVVVFNRCFESGAYFVSEHGRLVMAPDLYEEIYAQISAD